MPKIKLIKKNNCYQSVPNQNSNLQGYQFNQWEQIKEESQEIQDKFVNNNNKKVNVATYNVLFGSPKTSFDFILRNQTRFNYITQNIIPKSDNEVLGFCEVNTQFWENLKSSEYAHKNLFISQSQILYADKSHEVMLVSKFPFKSYFISDMSKNHMGRYLLTVFPHKNIEFSFIVIQAHTFAYEERYQLRLQQMEDINEFIQELKKNPKLLEAKEDSIFYTAIQNASKNNAIILQGDLNLHAPFETQFIYKTNFIDAWLESHGLKNKGFTWDAKQNSLIKLILPYDNRRMRLDRICLRENNQVFQIETSKILAQEKIQPFLCGSDHYMLQTTFVFNSFLRKFRYQFDYQEKKNYSELSDKTTKYRSIKQIVQLRLGTLFFILLILIKLVFFM